MTNPLTGLSPEQLREAVKNQLRIFMNTMEECGTDPYKLWRAALAGKKVRTVDVSPVIIFAEQIGGWWIRNDLREQEFIPIDEWKSMYAAWEAKRVKSPRLLQASTSPASSSPAQRNEPAGAA